MPDAAFLILEDFVIPDNGRLARAGVWGLGGPGG